MWSNEFVTKLHANLFSFKLVIVQSEIKHLKIKPIKVINISQMVNV